MINLYLDTDLLPTNKNYNSMCTYKEENRMKFDDLRDLALLNGIPDNKIYIGVWAKLNGYIKKSSKDKNRKNYNYYVKI